MKHSIFFILFILTLLGCQNITKPEKPKNLIGKDKMVEILAETYLINAARSVNNGAILAKGIKIDSLIYNKFEVDSLQFAKSNAYYASDVNSYIEIIQQVETRLTILDKKAESIIDLERARKDSISKILNEPKIKAQPNLDSSI